MIDAIEQEIEIPASDERHKWPRLAVSLARAEKRHVGKLVSLEHRGALKWVAVFSPCPPK